MSAKAPRKKIRWDLWMIVTVGVSIFYMLFLLYPLISMLSKSVIGEDGGFTWQYFAKVFQKKYYQISHDTVSVTHRGQSSLQTAVYKYMNVNG